MPRPLPALEAIHTIAFDFDGVFTDNKVWLDQDGKELVRCDRRDGLAFDLIRMFQRRGEITAEVFILSTEANPVVLSRAKKLQLTCHHGIKHKREFIEKYLTSRFREIESSLSGVVFIGNDINDVPLMRRVGYAVAPADAHFLALGAADLVLRNSGGEACVREFIEVLLRIEKFSPEEIDELISNS